MVSHTRAVSCNLKYINLVNISQAQRCGKLQWSQQGCHDPHMPFLCTCLQHTDHCLPNRLNASPTHVLLWVLRLHFQCQCAVVYLACGQVPPTQVNPKPCSSNDRPHVVLLCGTNSILQIISHLIIKPVTQSIIQRQHGQEEKMGKRRVNRKEAESKLQPRCG